MARQDDRRGGATQRTPEPGTNGKMNERDNRRIFVVLIVLLAAVVTGLLIFNGVWWSRP